MISYGIYGHLYGIGLIFQIGETAIGDVIRSHYIVNRRNGEIFFQHTQVHQVWAEKSVIPNLFDDFYLKVWNSLFVCNDNRTFP